MEQKRTLSKWISARKYIREFAANYAERYAEDPAEIERDIIAAKKHYGRARSSARTSPTAATSRSS